MDKRKKGQTIVSDEKFRHTFDFMLEGVQIHDFDWRYIYVNDALVKYSTYSKEELLGFTVMEKYPGIEQTDLFKVMQRCMNERTNERLETEFVFPDGTKGYFELSIQPVPEGVFILSIDATKRKLAEEKLEKSVAESKEDFLKIFNASPSGMVITDIESRKSVEINKGFLSTFGFERDEVVGLSPVELGVVSKEGQAKLAARLQELGYLKNEDIKCYTKTGKEIDCIVSTDIFEMEGKKRFLSIFHDVTHMKELERKTLESEEKFQKAFLASPAGIAITRLSDSCYLDVNDAFLEMTGYTKKEVVGHTSMDLKLIVNFEKREAALDYINKKGSARNLEFSIRSKSGKIREVLSSVETIILFGEKHAINAIYDITDRKKAEEQLKIVNKELEAFSYSVSHDLRAPLRAINGYATMIEEDYNNLFDDEGRRLLGTIQDNARMMGNLIDDLLTFSKLGKKEVQKTSLNMNDVFENVLLNLKNLTNHHAEIRMSSLLPVMGDYQLINQVVINLISNAIKYSSKKEKPVIEIASEEKNQEVIYTVRDNGEGFDMKYVDKLFGVFQRLHSAEEFEGTGVGLAIIKRIIDKHGGRAWAEGELGKGAAFYFTLPLKSN